MLPIEGITTPASGAGSSADAMETAPVAEAASAGTRDTVPFDALFAALLGQWPGPMSPAASALSDPPATHTSVTESAAYAARFQLGGELGAVSSSGPSGADDASPESAAPDSAMAHQAAGYAAQMSRDDASALRASPVALDVPSAVPSPASSAAHVAHRTLAGVDAELRARLDRVMERMQHEYGHVVQVVEGVRTQARQDALYAQGRTLPGAVVTWTRDSAHLDGHAVDVRIDGGYENAEAFRRLARIAREEGLKTLGPRDPGHLELSPAAGAPRETPSGRQTAGVGAAVAPVATVAAVATVAPVARVAPLARPAAAAAVATVSNGAVSASRPVAPTVERDSTAGTDPSARGDRSLQAMRVEDALARLAPALATTSDAGTSGGGTFALTGADVAARLEAVARIRDAQATQPISRLVMDVPDATGGVDRIAVQMRGGRVDAALTIADPMAASRLASRAELLSQALEARGYDAGAMQVSAARVMAPESLDLTRLAGIALEREGARGVASFLQDVQSGGTRDRQGSPGRHSDSSHTPRDGGPRDDTPRRQPKREEPGAR
jgi:hypothetical protein